MENFLNSVKSLFKTAEDYVEARIGLLKLKAVDKFSTLIASLGSAFFFAIIIFLFFFSFNIGLAFWIGNLLGKIYYGFFIVSGFYLLVGLFFYLFRHKLLKNPLKNMVIKKLLN
jgi:hypothetical protein